MANRQFSMISPALWTSKRFRGLSPGAQLGLLYIMSGPHSDSIGCYRLPNSYACGDRSIEAETWRAYLDELKEADCILTDTGAEYVLVRRWFKHNPLKNLDHAKGTKKRIARIESDRLREQCEVEFSEAETELQMRLAEKAEAKEEQSRKAKETSFEAFAPTSALLNTRMFKG